MRWFVSPLATDFTDAFPGSVLTEAVVLQLFASLLFHLMLFCLQLKMLIHMQIPLELLLVPFCTARWLYGTNSWRNGTQHCSQTIAGSYSNRNQSQLCHVTSCKSSFHEKNWKLFHATAWFATCRSTSDAIQPELVIRRKIQALIVAVTDVLCPKWEGALGYS